MRDEFDDVLARRRAKRRDAQRVKLLIGAGVAGCLVVGVTAIAFALSRHGGPAGAGVSLPAISGITGPSPASEGVTWNHQDMLVYLRSKGLNLRLTVADISERGGDRKSYLYKPQPGVVNQDGTDNPESVAIGYMYGAPGIIRVSIMPLLC